MQTSQWKVRNLTNHCNNDALLYKNLLLPKLLSWESPWQTPGRFYVTDSSCNKNLLLWKSEPIKSPLYDVTSQQGLCHWKWHFKVHFFCAQNHSGDPSSYNPILPFKIKQGKKESPGSSRDPQQNFTFGFYSSTFTKRCDFCNFPAALDGGTISCSPSTAQLGTRVNFTPSIIPLQGCCKPAASMPAFLNYPRQQGRGLSDGS